jgi:hypothetical protein
MPLFGAAGPASRCEGPQVRANQQPRGDLAPFMGGGVGRAVVDGAGVGDEAHKPSVLHAVAFFVGRGQPHLLAELDPVQERTLASAGSQLGSSCESTGATISDVAITHPNDPASRLIRWFAGDEVGQEADTRQTSVPQSYSP